MNIKTFLENAASQNQTVADYFHENFRWNGKWANPGDIFQGSLQIWAGSRKCSSMVVAKRKFEKLLTLMGASFTFEYTIYELAYVVNGEYKINLSRYKRKYGGGCGLFEGRY